MIFSNFSSIFTRSKRSAGRDSLEPAPPADLRELARRAVARDIVDFHTLVSVEGMGVLDARIMDISPYGFQSRGTSRMLTRGESVWVLLPLLGECKGDVMWGLKGLFGCKFHDPIEPMLYLELLPMLHGTHPGLSEST